MKIVNFFRVLLAHAYAVTALYLAAVFVMDSVKYHAFIAGAAHAFYDAIAK